jgi:anti-sigma regulatory factor (Ser/Thr protein kinase)
MPGGDRAGGGDPDDALTGGPDPSVSAATMVSPLDFPGIPADAARLVAVRRALQDWALAAGLPHTTATDLVLAAYEAMANSAEHAYRDRSGTIDLLATCGDDEVVVTVRDRGEWRPPPADPGHRGRGLMMIRSMSQAEVEPGPNGTTVRMRWPRR